MLTQMGYGRNRTGYDLPKIVHSIS